MKKNLMREVLIVMLLMGWAMAVVWTAERPGGTSHRLSGPRSGPTPEDVCRHRQSGDRVKFADNMGQTIKGVCRDFDGRLMAVGNNSDDALIFLSSLCFKGDGMRTDSCP